MQILSSEEFERLLGAVERPYYGALATAIFTGLRQGELLGLVWADVDFEAGVVRVRKQLDPKGNRVEPKTPSAKREIPLMPSFVTTSTRSGTTRRPGTRWRRRSGRS
jgi:integrase